MRLQHIDADNVSLVRRDDEEAVYNTDPSIGDQGVGAIVHPDNSTIEWADGEDRTFVRGRVQNVFENDRTCVREVVLGECRRP